MDDFAALNAVFAVFGEEVRLICWPEGEWWVYPQSEDEIRTLEAREEGMLSDDELRFSRFIDKGDDDGTDQEMVGEQEA